VRVCWGDNEHDRYKNNAAFTDVTKGTNKIGRGGQKLPYGFDAAPGWDPATGLGTPLFPKLMAAAMATEATAATVEVAEL
jgi:hypothetical protein